MGDILFGTTVVAAFIGGAVALFAPCCISVMLPAYFATSFRRRRALISMTLVFGLGIAAVILPIALGATWLTGLIIEQHTPVFIVGGVVMLVLGAVTLAGWKLPLPMPGMQARSDRRPGSVFVLGAFSGTASACCAPVLAGVVALSGAAGSFVVASVVGVAYVFGMVVPLFVIALLWDRYDWGSSALLRGRTLTLRAFGHSRQVHTTALVSGVLLMVMGLIVFALAFSDSAMTTSGWQADLGARLQHYASVVLGWVGVVPGWVSAVAVFAALALILRAAVRQYIVNTGSDDDHDEASDDDDDVSPQPPLATTIERGERV